MIKFKKSHILNIRFAKIWHLSISVAKIINKGKNVHDKYKYKDVWNRDRGVVIAANRITKDVHENRKIYIKQS